MAIDARLQGYTESNGRDPFEHFVGPLYYRFDAEGNCRCAFIIERKHVNGQGNLHGGMLMTFADFAMFFIAQKCLGDLRAVTVTLNGEFTSAAKEGEFVEAIGEVVHETGGMVFVRGTIVSEDRVLLNFSGVLKKLRPAV